MPDDVRGPWRGRRLLVVVAHPDDETFGCGSVIAEVASSGGRVTVCCATRGEAGELREGCELGAGTLADLRVRELHEAGSELGATEFVLLDFVDSGMTGDASPDTLFGAPIDAVVAAVREVIGRVDPDVIVTLDPSGGDGHRDRSRIGQATIEAACQAATGASLYSWCVTRSLLLRWLGEQRVTNPDREHLELDHSELGRPDEDITTVLDGSRHVELRKRASALHRSQHSPFEGMPDDLVSAFIGEDRLVRVEPPWTGGPIERELFVPEHGR
jgi:LmbE family N-acetylglucosaminyl deacetylase